MDTLKIYLYFFGCCFILSSCNKIEKETNLPNYITFDEGYETTLTEEIHYFQIGVEEVEDNNDSFNIEKKLNEFKLDELNETSEQVYYYNRNAINTNDFDSDFKDELIRDTCFRIGLDSSQKEIFTRNYLDRKDMYKEIPDGAVYRNQAPIIEYFEDSEKNWISFIIHLNYKDSKVYRKQDNSHDERTYCVTADLRFAEYIGDTICAYDQENNVLYQKVFSKKGEIMTYTSYEYTQDIPFPFIVDYIEYERLQLDPFYNRNQRIHFYKDKVDLDQDGKWIGYKDCIYRPLPENESQYFKCFYDEQGKLESIHEIDGDDTGITNTSEQVFLQYQNNGKLRCMNYVCKEQAMSLAEEVYFDDDERVVWCSGLDYDILYAYEENKKLPFAIIYITGIISYGENDIYYGQNTTFYIFEEIE